MKLNKYWYGAIIAFATCTIAVVILLLYGIVIPDISQGAISFFKDVVALIVPIASFVVGTYYARKAYKFHQEVAGRKPDLKFLINNDILIPKSQLGHREVAFGYSVEKDARVLCVIPFVIRNDGEVDAENISVRAIMPANISALGITEIDARANWIEFPTNRLPSPR